MIELGPADLPGAQLAPFTISNSAQLRFDRARTKWAPLSRNDLRTLFVHRRRRRRRLPSVWITIAGVGGGSSLFHHRRWQASEQRGTGDGRGSWSK